MPNVCHSTLKAYGPTHLAAQAREAVAAVFGPCLPDYSNPFLETESDNPPLAVVRIESHEVPPVMLVEELSKQLPQLTLVLLYDTYLGGRRGHRKYIAGQVTEEHHEQYCFESEALCPSGSTGAPRVDIPATEAIKASIVAQVRQAVAVARLEHAREQPVAGQASPSSPRELAKHCLASAYKFVWQRTQTGRELSPADGKAMREHFRVCDDICKLLDEEAKFYIDQLDEQYQLRAKRLTARREARESLLAVLGACQDPDIAAALDAQDLEALMRCTPILHKLSA